MKGNRLFWSSHSLRLSHIYGSRACLACHRFREALTPGRAGYQGYIQDIPFCGSNHVGTHFKDISVIQQQNFQTQTWAMGQGTLEIYPTHSK